MPIEWKPAPSSWKWHLLHAPRHFLIAMAVPPLLAEPSPELAGSPIKVQPIACMVAFLAFRASAVKWVSLSPIACKPLLQTQFKASVPKFVTFAKPKRRSGTFLPTCCASDTPPKGHMAETPTGAFCASHVDLGCALLKGPSWLVTQAWASARRAAAGSGADCSVAMFGPRLETIGVAPPGPGPWCRSTALLAAWGACSPWHGGGKVWDSWLEPNECCKSGAPRHGSLATLSMSLEKGLASNSVQRFLAASNACAGWTTASPIAKPKSQSGLFSCAIASIFSIKTTNCCSTLVAKPTPGLICCKSVSTSVQMARASSRCSLRLPVLTSGLLCVLVLALALGMVHPFASSGSWSVAPLRSVHTLGARGMQFVLLLAGSVHWPVKTSGLCVTGRCSINPSWHHPFCPGPPGNMSHSGTKDGKQLGPAWKSRSVFTSCCSTLPSDVTSSPNEKAGEQPGTLVCSWHCAKGLPPTLQKGSPLPLSAVAPDTDTCSTSVSAASKLKYWGPDSAKFCWQWACCLANRFGFRHAPPEKSPRSAALFSDLGSPPRKLRKEIARKTSKRCSKLRSLPWHMDCKTSVTAWTRQFRAPLASWECPWSRLPTFKALAKETRKNLRHASVKIGNKLQAALPLASCNLPWHDPSPKRNCVHAQKTCKRCSKAWSTPRLRPCTAPMTPSTRRCKATHSTWWACTCIIPQIGHAGPGPAKDESSLHTALALSPLLGLGPHWPAP